MAGGNTFMNEKRVALAASSRQEAPVGAKDMPDHVARFVRQQPAYRRRNLFGMPRAAQRQAGGDLPHVGDAGGQDRKSTRLNSSHI